jgi:hypothetical protein
MLTCMLLNQIGTELEQAGNGVGPEECGLDLLLSSTLALLGYMC